MWGALKSTASLLKSTLYDKFGGSLILKHNCKIHEFSMQIIRGTHAPFTKTYLVRLDFSQRWQVWSLSFLCFLAAESLKTSKSNYDHLFLPLVKIYLYQLVSKAIFKLERLFPLACLASRFPQPMGVWSRWTLLRFVVFWPPMNHKICKIKIRNWISSRFWGYPNKSLKSPPTQ